jgi:bifunctional UDP-N-acetylglucosamine pyrophosphorylase/glucosamine-1-phosphate N-acetyltransferase
MIKVYIKVEKVGKKSVITDVKFETYGCVAAIAASDTICELAKGKTLDEVMKLSYNDVVKALDGLPPVKFHCSIMGINALKKAVEEYRKKPNEREKEMEENKENDNEENERMGGQIMKVTKAVIMAAGNGKRMWPLTETRPKVLLPVAGKPITYHQLVALKKAGIREFIFIVRDKKEELISYLQQAAKEFSVKIEYVEQGEDNGTGAALLCASGKVKERFIVVSGDLLFDADVIRQVVDASENNEITVAVRKVNNPGKYGVIEVSNGKVSYIEEKPKNPKSNLVNTSIYCMKPTVFVSLKKLKKSERGEYELTDLLVGSRAVEVAGYWKDIGYPWDLLDATADMLRKMDAKNGAIENSTITGKVIMEEGSKIINSYIEGDVYIGKNTIIGPNAYVRGPSAIGDNCHISGATTVKASILFDDVNAKHLSYIGDSVIGSHVNFGSGTQIANFRFDEGNINVLTEKGWVNSGKKKLGAVIGDNVKFGVLSATMPGKLVGANAWIHSGVIVNKNVPSNVYVFVRQEVEFMKQPEKKSD